MVAQTIISLLCAVCFSIPAYSASYGNDLIRDAQRAISATIGDAGCHAHCDASRALQAPRESKLAPKPANAPRGAKRTNICAAGPTQDFFAFRAMPPKLSLRPGKRFPLYDIDFLTKLPSAWDRGKAGNVNRQELADEDALWHSPAHRSSRGSSLRSI